MDKVSGKLTVFFEDPFWVGVFERVTMGRSQRSRRCTPSSSNSIAA